MSHKKYHSDTAFLDLFLNSLLSFVLLFIVSWLLINPIAKNKNVESKGEFLVIATWDDDKNDDVDLYVQDPAGNTASFRQKEVGVMHLDRDDLGFVNDKILLNNGDILEVKTNREVLTIRGIVPGEFVINLHMYSKRSEGPTNIKVEIIKINPNATVFSKDFVMDHRGEEITAIRFTVDDDGKTFNLNDVPKSLANAVDNYSSGGVLR